MTHTITSHSRIFKLCMASILAIAALASFFWLAAQAGEIPNSPLATPPPDAFIGRNGSICLYNSFATAMNASSSGDKLFIKQGTHLKTIGTITKTLTFAAATPNCTTPSSTRVTLNANDLSRMAIINPSTTVTFTNLILTHGSDDNGGILFMSNNSKVVLKHTDLYFGDAAFSGGAVYMLQGGTLVIQNDSWLNANAAAGSVFGGGAIYAYSSTITISDTSKIGYFNGNITDGSGGGIYLDRGALNMYDSSGILSNVASSRGGGVYALNGAKVYLHDNASIGWTQVHYDNQALDGGGIYMYGSGTGLLMYDDSSIENNVADHYGGGIYLGWGSFANLASASVISNTALTQGGGILVDDYSQLVTGNSQLIQDNQTIDPSVADSNGGGISIPGDNSTVIIQDSAVFSNTSSGYGGGIAMLGDSTLSLNAGTELAYNIAQTHDGGGLAITQGALTVTGSLIHDNESARNGGGIALLGGTLKLVDANIRSNQASWSGGGVFQQAGGVYMEALSNEAWIYDNLAGILGGGIYTAGDVTLTIFAKTSDTYHIDSNEADDNGGGIFATTGADLLLVGNISVDDNTADLSGGGFYLGSDVRARLLDLPAGRHIQIAGNTASTGDGGGIYSNDSREVTIWGGVIGALGASNQALAGDGGGIYAEGSHLFLKNTILQYNQADMDGGGIAAVNTQVEMDSSNVQPTLQDAIPMSPSGVPEPCNPLLLAKDHYCSEIRGNSAGMLGGGIYLNDSQNADITHTALIGNNADNGSALYMEDSIVNLSHSLARTNISNGSLTSAAHVHDSNNSEPPATRLNAINNTFANNNYEAVTYQIGTQMYFLNNIIWNNGSLGRFLGTHIQVSCNDTQNSALPYPGNVSWDPLFVTTWRGDYRLGVHSNAIDACAAYTSLDLDGIPRPQGSGNDMGSFEARWNYVLFLPVVVK